MTSTTALVIAFSLIINDMSLLWDSNFLSGRHISANIVYVLSNCLLLKKLNIYPLQRKFHPVRCFLEIPIILLLLECSLFYVWNTIQWYILQHAHDILACLSEECGLSWLVCQLCCGKRDCSEGFTVLLLKVLSFVILLIVVSFTSINFPIRPQPTGISFPPAGSAAARVASHSNQRAMHRNRIERTASKRWRGSVRRLLSAAVFNLSCFTHGCSTGWVSGVLGSEALAGGAWLAALPSLVALPAAPFFAVLADAKGRKAGALCICVSFILSWSLAAWCGARGVWAARVAAGAGGAGALVLAPLYCAEISPKTKGLAAMPSLACSCGVLFAFAAGGVLSAHALSLLMAAAPTILLFSLMWLPESPSFLINAGRMQDAAKVICWLDGSDFREDLTDAIEQQEVMIRTGPSRRGSDALQPMLKRSRSEGTSEGRELSACRELFRHRRSRRALLSCCLLLTAAAGSGAGAVNSFAAAVLAHSGHALPALNLTAYNLTIHNGTVARGWREPAETGSVLCGTALVLGAAAATATVDRLGRKVLLLISCFGIAFCLILLATYCDPRLHLYWYSQRLWSLRRISLIKEKPFYNNFTIISNITKDTPLRNNTNDIMGPYYRLSLTNESVIDGNVGRNVTRVDKKSIWPPVILLSMVVFLFNIGLGSVPFVLISELFSVNVRSLASGFLISWMWLNSFFTLRYFGPFAKAIGLHGTYYVGASITFMVAAYIFLTLPETKGRNQKQIEELLDGPLLVHAKRKRSVDEP